MRQFELLEWNSFLAVVLFADAAGLMQLSAAVTARDEANFKLARVEDAFEVCLQFANESLYYSFLSSSCTHRGVSGAGT